MLYVLDRSTNQKERFGAEPSLRKCFSPFYITDLFKNFTCCTLSNLHFINSINSSVVVLESGQEQSYSSPSRRPYIYDLSRQVHLRQSPNAPESMVLVMDLSLSTDLPGLEYNRKMDWKYFSILNGKVKWSRWYIGPQSNINLLSVSICNPFSITNACVWHHFLWAGPHFMVRFARFLVRHLLWCITLTKMYG